jgi:triacylglycerol esterase/lipase EstA (alpha/beta hydrolase family)
VVFVHGMHGDGNSFRDLCSVLADHPDVRDAELLVFLFPANGSLACGGEMLAREMARVVRDPARASFVGHSAGGLVFRYYAEKKHGAFDRAVLLGVPHAGSQLTPL